MELSTRDLQAMAERLEKVEKENRRLKRIGATILLLAVAALLMGQRTQPVATKVVEAETFVLKDANGRMRGMLEVVPAEGPAITLFHADGKPGMFLKLQADQPQLGLIEASGRSGAFLSVIKKIPNLRLDDANGITRVLLAGQTILPGLQIADTNGAPRVILGLDKNSVALMLKATRQADQVGIIILDPNERVRALLALNERFEPGLALTDSKGKVISSIP